MSLIATGAERRRARHATEVDAESARGKYLHCYFLFSSTLDYISKLHAPTLAYKVIRQHTRLTCHY